MNPKEGREGVDGSIVLFDGDCGFCRGLAAFVEARDRARHFRLLPLQSAEGKRLLVLEAPPETWTLVLLDGDRSYHRSTAALRIAAGLDGAWRLARVLLVVPAPIRDFVYRLVARHRYRLAQSNARTPPGHPQSCTPPRHSADGKDPRALPQ